MIPQNPPGFIIETEIGKAAFQNGFRRPLGWQNGWASFASTTAHGTLALAAASNDGPWLLSLTHPGVIAELTLPPAPIQGPGAATYIFPTLTALYAALPRIYDLSRTLPNAPLEVFQAATANLPRETEAQRLTIQRIGQNIFRDNLLTYWNHTCPLTGITDTALLRSSHIIPWKDCETDAERLNTHNGLLLSALWDAAFDRGLVSFDDAGQPLYARTLSQPARTNLTQTLTAAIVLTDHHRSRLAHHRTEVFEMQGSGTAETDGR